MPTQIDADFCKANAELFREARLAVRHEFSHLGSHDQYFNAFARLLKWDPLGRVAMLGTDQRDQFVPLVRQLIGARPARPQILDLGCGDGRSFALIADALAEGAVVDILDPNPDYV
jgi:hypothetical protein